MKKGTRRYVVILAAVILMLTGQACDVHALATDAGMQTSALAGGPDFKPRLGTYFYCFEFNSMNIGTACIAIEREGDLYRMVVTARTNDKIDYVYRIRYRGENLTDIDPLTPVETKIRQNVKSTEKDIVIKFQGDGTIHTSEKVKKKGDLVDDELRKIHTTKFTADPFSATYLARGIDWKIGMEKIFDVYTGKGRYELRLKCAGKTVVYVQGNKRESWVIVPTARDLDPHKKHVETRKQPDIRIYLSDDGLKDVLKVEASHTMGTFLVLLDRFEPSAQQANAAGSQKTEQAYPGK